MNWMTSAKKRLKSKHFPSQNNRVILQSSVVTQQKETLPIVPAVTFQSVPALDSTQMRTSMDGNRFFVLKYRKLKIVVLTK
jgi:hypothetical protein